MWNCRVEAQLEAVQQSAEVASPPKEKWGLSFFAPMTPRSISSIPGRR